MSRLARLLRRSGRPGRPVLLDDGSLPRIGGSADPARSDSAVVAEIGAAGHDLARPVLVVHLLRLPDELALTEAASLVGQEGYVLSATSDGAEGFNVRASRTQLLTGLSVAQERSRMAGLAQRLGGDVDGWEALGPATAPRG